MKKRFTLAFDVDDKFSWNVTEIDRDILASVLEDVVKQIKNGREYGKCWVNTGSDNDMEVGKWELT